MKTKEIKWKSRDNKYVLSIDFDFGSINSSGYRHFAFLHLAFGTNGFVLAILGIHITAKLW